MLEINHLDANFVLVFAKQLLGIIGAIEVFALCIFAGAGVVAADDEMRATVVFANKRVPDRLTGACHAHGQIKQ